MGVDRKTVDRIAELARLEFNEAEKEEITNDMNKMLDFVDKLSEVNTDGVEPLVYMLDESTPLRPDVVKQEISQKEALKNAPQKDSDFIKVPKVIERN
ncbi:MAG: Asp-tRNA(Asn)/Glu-tRNA(Gln) amidotransferase subunit GatC [Bacteroidetes bacterium]|nr:MAG: Asp-tRNA(Asn)/Glu-tRNA(Gln) amidotransferase subunit GatC [Bacteroidota bacterium]MBL1143407.1 Asp-tRNA(Asn)/Glu-tRNA(Gln) amidotransferase subunit GatC [Bacteroidota bacterium]MCB0801470.1 Asp-tRNA(Asn)/Glu-tRNA(Gln) amidotransferase subunit GatC [Flavobacteriales bacterium]NOG56211.1 Asp-tRNA(Asn)/Glu-tRNA(Gln) amidotransferase subunit GatC [Bacteroidota bacterium]